MAERLPLITNALTNYANKKERAITAAGKKLFLFNRYFLKI